ncbi:MAG: hypothetical protein C5B60_02380 [Chloroflexi bacterium]|nr:MAG: hypothetical protein C5B60_02380 [Chloroflexota bacterium]
MLRAPIDYTFTIEGQRYRLVEWDRGGERRFRAEYALAIASAPDVLGGIDGQDLYTEAVARECLREAPDLFWTQRPPAAGSNGTLTRVPTFEHIPHALWEVFRQEVNTFLTQVFPPLPTTDPPAPPGGSADAVPVADAQAVPAVFRGRAE